MSVKQRIDFCPSCQESTNQNNSNGWVCSKCHILISRGVLLGDLFKDKLEEIKKQLLENQK